MKIRILSGALRAVLLGALLGGGANALASTVSAVSHDDHPDGKGAAEQPAEETTQTVFEIVELFHHTTYFTESFEIDTPGTYQAILTDFEFPQPLHESALNITTATDTLATLLGTGTLLFDATPGIYYVSLFAVAGHGQAGEKMPDMPPPWAGPGDHPHHAYHGGLGQYGLQISQVSAVPLPAAFWLLLSGGAVLGAAARRRKDRA